MSQTTTSWPQVLHRLPGRARLHLPGWSGQRRPELEQALCRVPGIHSARADTLTRNILVRFDPRAITEADLEAVLARLASGEQTKAAPRSELGCLARHALSEALFWAIGCVEPFGLPIAVFWALQLGFGALCAGPISRPDHASQVPCVSAV